jgi:hypothetical protein
MRSERKQPYVAKVAPKMSFPAERHFKNGKALEAHAKGHGFSVPIAISRAMRVAFKKPCYQT